MCPLLNKEVHQLTQSPPRPHHQHCPPVQPYGQWPQRLTPLILQQFMIINPSNVLKVVRAEQNNRGNITHMYSVDPQVRG